MRVDGHLHAASVGDRSEFREMLEEGVPLGLVERDRYVVSGEVGVGAHDGDARSTCGQRRCGTLEIAELVSYQIFLVQHHGYEAADQFQTVAVEP